jgi:hypothetical protein
MTSNARHSLKDVQEWTDFDGGTGGDLRRFSRATVETCRPLALQLLDAEGQPIGPWTLADILDISLGGLCLLIDHQFFLPDDQDPLRVRLDLRAQPGFGSTWLPATVRWYVQSGYVLSLGLGFDRALITLPTLLPCRRSQRRELDASFELDSSLLSA